MNSTNEKISDAEDIKEIKRRLNQIEQQMEISKKNKNKGSKKVLAMISAILIIFLLLFFIGIYQFISGGN